jgi:asparagine synthase (glutamine-hydrolysing)
MCGIAGYFSKKAPLAGDSENVLYAMGEAIKHRGPDAIGIWLSGNCNVGLVHTRLSILDCSTAGRQPMKSRCGRYILIFNGEIYNHLSLRKKIEEDFTDVEWRGSSDTETLITCISLYGIDSTLPLLVGMFAVAVYDIVDETITLARDRCGEKPLYYGWCGDAFLFSSELSAIQKHPDFSGELDMSSLFKYLKHNYIPSPKSIYKNIKKLNPGSYLCINLRSKCDSNEVKKYWDLTRIISDAKKTRFEGAFTEAVVEIERQLELSVKGQLLSDVPLGAFLSGGIDSSLIVSLMQTMSSQKVKTFSIGFNEDDFNEAVVAKQVAMHLGTEHHEFYVSSIDAMNVIPKLASVYSEPFADSSQIPTYLLSKMTKSYVTVALSGDGGDEVFGGYDHYRLVPLLWKYLKNVPESIRHLTVKMLNDLPLPLALSKILRILPSTNSSDLYYTLLSQWHNPSSVLLDKRLFSGPILNDEVFDTQEEWMMYVDSMHYLPDDILVKVDRAAMHNSLETRAPFLDHRLIELAWTMPKKYKIENGTGKILLREILYKYVPKELINRPKKGFCVPIADWLRGDLKSWAESLLNEEFISLQGLFDYKVLSKIWMDHISGKRDNQRYIWNILMFQLWYVENKEYINIK